MKKLSLELDKNPLMMGMHGTKILKGKDGKSAYEIWLEQGNEGTEEDFLKSLKGDDYILTETDKEEIADMAAEKAGNAQDTANDALVLIAKLREDFEYKPIAVSSVSCNAQSVQELGTQLSGVVISWSVNKTPASQSVNGTQVAVQEGVTNYSCTDTASYKPTEVTTKKWTVTATDERGAAAQNSVSVIFCNGIYTGVVQGNGQPSRDTLLALTKKLQNSRALTFTATADAGWHLICALPSRLGTPAFKDKDTGFEAGFSKMYADISFENGSGYTENYDIWLSNKSGLGTITVAVT